MGRILPVLGSATSVKVWPFKNSYINLRKILYVNSVYYIIIDCGIHSTMLTLDCLFVD